MEKEKKYTVFLISNGMQQVTGQRNNFANCLVVGISSRALFDLEEENKIFEEQGVAAYAEYQIKNETNILKLGSGFALV